MAGLNKSPLTRHHTQALTAKEKPKHKLMYNKRDA
jgi:hypothetical protein